MQKKISYLVTLELQCAYIILVSLARLSCPPFTRGKERQGGQESLASETNMHDIMIIIKLNIII